MKISANPVGNAINQYLMRAALPFGGYFIVEYLVRNYSASHIMLGFLNIPLMFFTVVILYFIMKRMRDKLLDGKIAGFMAWTFGTQLMLFAGLIEAAFIYVFNEFIVPTNLSTVHAEMIAQYENVLSQIQSMPKESGILASATDTMQQTLDILKESPVSSAIEAAISTLSNDIFFGMILMAFIAPIIRKK